MQIVCQFYLAVLSCYHIFSGGLSYFAGPAAMRFYKSFYGTDPVERRHLLLILKPWGALSIAVGIAGIAAAAHPEHHPATVFALWLLLVLRIGYRIACRHELAAVSCVPARRNAISILVLACGATILGAWLLTNLLAR